MIVPILPGDVSMSIHLLRDLEHLQRQVMTLAGAVESVIYKSIKALIERNGVLAQEVIDGDDQIDLMEVRIYEECLKIQALHQPVAKDLRRIVSVFMISTELERMGDLAVDIAGRAISLVQLPSHTLPANLQAMTDVAASMVRQSLDSYANLDSRQARRVIRLDDVVDRYNDEIIEELIRSMKQSPDLVEPCLSLFSVTRHLERIADHATNIAEDVYYLVEGDIVRHRHESLGPDS
jgi:phosphate transport system protein